MIKLVILKLSKERIITRVAFAQQSLYLGANVIENEE